MSAPGGVCLLWGVSTLGGMSALGGCLLWGGGCLLRGVCSGGCLFLGAGGVGSALTQPGETATAADGTHPTGMHSCLNNRFFCTQKYVIKLFSRNFYVGLNFSRYLFVFFFL